MSDPVKKRQRRGRTVYVIDFSYYDERGRKRRYRKDASAQTTLTAARAEAKRLIESAAKTGDPHGEEPSMVILSDFVDEKYRPIYLPKLRPGTREKYEERLRLHVLPYFGDFKLPDIQAAECDTFLTYLQEEKGLGASRRHVITTLRAVLRAAVRQRDLAAFPQDLPTVKQSKKLPTCPDPDEVMLILEHTSGWLRLAVALMAFAGVRISEARSLVVEDYDPHTKLLTVRRTYSGDQDGGVLVETTKDSEERVVPIIIEPLRTLLIEAIKDKLPKAPILLTEDGNVPRRQYARDRLLRAQKRAGLKPYSPHHYRHFFITTIGTAGGSLEALRRMTGHADLKTLARYFHAFDRDLFDTVAKLK